MTKLYMYLLKTLNSGSANLVSITFKTPFLVLSYLTGTVIKAGSTSLFLQQFLRQIPAPNLFSSTYLL